MHQFGRGDCFSPQPILQMALLCMALNDKVSRKGTVFCQEIKKRISKPSHRGSLWNNRFSFRSLYIGFLSSHPAPCGSRGVSRGYVYVLVTAPVLDGGGSAAFAVSAKVMIASTCPTIRRKDARNVFLISFAGQVFKGKKVQNTVRFKKIKYFCSVGL